MTPEIVERVDAWIGARVPDGSDDPLVWLVSDWRKACALWRYRRAKDPEDASGAVASAEAAMVGLLLALVRWAWDWNVWAQSSFDSDIWLVMCPKLGPDRDGRPLIGSIDIEGHTEAEALVAALEAAPRREAS